MRSTSTAVLLPLLFAACGTHDNGPGRDRYGRDLSAEPLLKANALGAQSFAIDNSKDTVVFGQRGTIVTIPAGCFDDANGPVQVELIEALDMSDLLLLNAPTISNGKLLVTDGVVYVNAFANGEALDLKSGKTLEIEIPSRKHDPEMRTFVGEYDANGRMNWTRGNEIIKSIEKEVGEELTYQFLRIPMDLFPNRAQYFTMDSIARAYPYKNGELYAPIGKLLIGRDRAEFYANATAFLDDPRSATTPLATREFAERLQRMEEFYHYTYWDEADGRSHLKHDVFGPFQKRVFQVYLDNMDRELWFSDSLALNVMHEWLPDHSNDSSDLSTYKAVIEWFDHFKSQRLTRPLKIDDHGVDLTQSGAYKALLDKGVEKKEARRLVEIAGLQREAIQELKNGRTATAALLAQEREQINEEKEAVEARYYLISADQLGWINVDRFYDNENARECEVIAQVDLPAGADKVNVSMVFAKARTFIDGIRSEDGSYHFTKDEEYHRRLPVGEEATMVAIAYSGGKPWLATKRITIAEKMNERLSLTAMSMDEFKAALKEVN